MVISSSNSHSRIQRVFHQHGNGHRTNAAGNRRDKRRFGGNLVKINISRQLAIFQTIHTNINY